jgi:hypothetical protein
MPQLTEPTTAAPPPQTEQRKEAGRPKEAPDRAPRERRRHPVLRFLLRAFVVVVILLVIAAVAIQLVLMSDLPHKIAIPIVEKALGLRIEAGSLSTGWLGHTTLKDVKVSLPLAQKAFFETSELKVDHTSLPMILLLRTVELDAIRLEKPKLIVLQDPSGKWNLQEVAELLGKIGGAKTGQETEKKSGVPKLPRVTLADGMVQVIDNQRREADVPLDVKGFPQDPLVYQYEVHVGGDDRIYLKGDLAPGGVWKHQVDFVVQKLDPLVRAWTAKLPQPLMVKGHWVGIAIDGGVTGRLRLDDVKVNQVQSSGIINVEAKGGAVVLRPEGPKGVHVYTGMPSVPELLAAGGSIKVDGKGAFIDSLHVAALGGLIEVGGHYTLADGSAALEAAWRDVMLSKDLTQRGSLTVNMSPQLGGRRLDAKLNTHGKMAAGEWDANVNVAGAGKTWADTGWTITVPKAEWDRGNGRVYDVNGLTIKMAVAGQKLSVTEMRLPTDGRFLGRGEFNFADKTWWLYSQGAGWDVPRSGGAKVGFVLNTWGNPDLITIKQLYVNSAEMQLTAEGYYGYSWPKPLQMKAYLEHVAGKDGLIYDNPPVKGKVWGWAWVGGEVAPPNVQIQGGLVGEKVSVNDRPLGDIKLAINGNANQDEAVFDTDKMELFKGQWELHGMFPTEAKKQKGQWYRGETAGLDVTVEGLSLGDMAAVGKSKAVDGILSGEWSFEFPKLDRNQARMRGHFGIQNLAAGPALAEEVGGDMSLENGVLKADPVRLKHKDGRAEVQISTNLNQPTAVDLGATLAAWPLDVPAAKANVLSWGDAKLAVDLKKLAAVGPINLRANVAISDRQVGDAKVRVQVRGRVAEVTDIDASVLGGKAVGHAMVDVDHPLAATALIEWKDVDAAQVSELWPRTAGLAGKYGGVIQVAPSTDPRALEPLHVQIGLRPNGGNYRGVDIHDSQFSVYADKDRVVMDYGLVHMADGELRVFARATKHPGDLLFSNLILDFDNLNIDKLVHAVKYKAKPYPGKLSGNLSVMGNPAKRDQMVGEATVKITDSDLVSWPPLKAMYDLMHLGLNPQKPTGHGSIAARIEQGNLSITRAYYFNRGIEARGVIDVKRIWDMPDSPISGQIVGTAQPLKNTKLPFLADINDVMKSLQATTTPIGVRGTVFEPEAYAIVFQELGDVMKRFLTGDVESETRGTAGQ